MLCTESIMRELRWKLYRTPKSVDDYTMEDAVAFVNKVRISLGMSKLSSLPELYSHNFEGNKSYKCAIAYACIVGYRKDFKAYSDHEVIHITTPDGPRTFTMPGSVFWFLARPYQQGRYTVLEARWSGKHSYSKRYNVCQGNMSRYTDSAEEVADMVAEGNVNFVNDGYADEIGHDNCTEIIRRSGKSIPLEKFHMVLKAA